MWLNSKHTVEDLERYIQMYLKDGVSFKELSETFGLGASTFNQNVLRYQKHGLQGIQTKSRNNRFSKAFKQSVINEYLMEGWPIKQLARKYNIPSSETVRSWIIKYARGEKSYSPKPVVYTMKSRKTTRREN